MCEDRCGDCACSAASAPRAVGISTGAVPRALATLETLRTAQNNGLRSSRQRRSEIDDPSGKAVHSVSGEEPRKYLGVPGRHGEARGVDEFTPTECQQQVVAGVVAVLVKINKENERVLLRIFSGLDGTHALEGLVADATSVRVIEAGEFAAKPD